MDSQFLKEYPDYDAWTKAKVMNVINNVKGHLPSDVIRMITSYIPSTSYLETLARSCAWDGFAYGTITVYIWMDKVSVSLNCHRVPGTTTFFEHSAFLACAFEEIYITDSSRVLLDSNFWEHVRLEIDLMKEPSRKKFSYTQTDYHQWLQVWNYTLASFLKLFQQLLHPPRDRPSQYSKRCKYHAWK